MARWSHRPCACYAAVLPDGKLVPRLGVWPGWFLVKMERDTYTGSLVTHLRGEISTGSSHQRGGCANACLLECWGVKVKRWACFKFWDNTSRFQSRVCVCVHLCVYRSGRGGLHHFALDNAKAPAARLYGKVCVWTEPVSFLNARPGVAWLPSPGL